MINNEMNNKNILKKLCYINAVSGYEKDVIDFLFNILKISELDDLHIDNLGNLICLRKGIGDGKKIMISAHVDEVGFQVLKEKTKGEYQIKTLGNISTYNAINQRVKSKTEKGVIYSVDDKNIEKYNFENVILKCDKTSNINIGDIFSFDSQLVETDEMYIGKAIDNRISCFCLYNLIQQKIETKSDIYYVFTVQEEISMRGARVVKTSLKPDICINIDVSPECNNNSLVAGNGVGIKMSDSIGVSDNELVELIKNYCQDNNIEYQIEVSNCGTTELIISNELDMGIKEVGISLPCKYMHTANTIVYKNDINNLVILLSKILYNS